MTKEELSKVPFRMVSHMDMVGDHFNITYNVKTRKYTWQGKEYDSLPDAFREKEG